MIRTKLVLSLRGLPRITLVLFKMAGSHRDRIERLEAKFETLETGVAKIDRIERKLERVLRQLPTRPGTSSSSDESDASDTSSDDIRAGQGRRRRGTNSQGGRQLAKTTEINMSNLWR